LFWFATELLLPGLGRRAGTNTVESTVDPRLASLLAHFFTFSTISPSGF